MEDARADVARFEAEAYHAMRKMAMDRNIRIIDVAQKLLAMNELLA